MARWISFSPRTKSILLLLSTLALGVVLGAVLTGWWIQERADRVRGLRTVDGFVERVTRNVEPTSDAQRDSVQAIAHRSALRLQTLRQNHRRETFATLDSMRQAFEPVLTDKQMARLGRRLPDGPGRFGPPRPGPERRRNR